MTGSERSFEVLRASTSDLTDKELSLLEAEIDFFDRTGLIGVKMSRLLVDLYDNHLLEAA